MSTNQFNFKSPIRIGDDWWRVAERSMDEYGLCDYEAKTIWINPKQGKAEARRTLIHEILHATCDALTEAYVERFEYAVKDSGLL